MDTGSWLILISILLLVGLIISRPYFGESHPKETEQSKLDSLANDLAELTLEKENFLSALQDLDNDHELERIPDDAYANQREKLVHASARVIHQMDELEKQITSTRMIHSMENSDKKIQEPEARDAIEDMIAERRKLRDEISAGFCPQCGKVIRKSDQFCPACGLKVSR